MISEFEKKLSPLLHHFFIPREKAKNSTDPFLVLPSLKAPRIVVPVSRFKIYRQAFRVHNTASFKNRVMKLGLKYSYPLTRHWRDRIVIPTPAFTDFFRELTRRLQHPEKLFAGIYVGTPGKNQKLTWQLMTATGKVVGYAKIGDNPENTSCIKSEFDVCQKLALYEFRNGEFPENMFWGKIGNISVLVQSPLARPSRFTGLNLNEKIILFLAELSRLTGNPSPFGTAEFTKKIVRSLKTIPVLPGNLVADLMGVIKRLNAVNVPFGLYHGDFVPYNVRVLKDRLFVLDWEFARQNYPPFFDLFHFLFQGHFQIRGLPVEKIIQKKIWGHRENMQLIKTYANLIQVPPENILDFFKLYLLDALVFDMANRPETRAGFSQFFQALIFMNKFFTENKRFTL